MRLDLPDARVRIVLQCRRAEWAILETTILLLFIIDLVILFLGLKTP